MRFQGLGWFLLGSFNLVLTIGCLENKGAQEVLSDALNNSEFQVEAPTEELAEGAGKDLDSENPLPSPVSEVEDPSLARGILINYGRKVSLQRSLTLSYEPAFVSSHLKLSQNAQCEGGVWKNYISEESQSVEKSGYASYSVQFRDHDGRMSVCYGSQILVDDEGPEIIYSKYPSVPVEEGFDVEVVYSVKDSYSSIKKVECEFAGVVKPCASGSATIKFPSLIAGDYSLKIKAEDALGNRSEKDLNFRVTSLYKRLSQAVKVNPYQKVDILFVVDNSGSMEYEQQNMSQRVGSFLEIVRGLDWQIAVTTTDAVSSKWGDGRLLSFKGLSNEYILRPSLGENIAKNALSSTLQRSETGDKLEQGIKATYRVLERGQESPGVNRDLIRDNAHFAVVLISDEDESANGIKNDPANLIKYIQSTYGMSKAFSFHSIITKPGDRACKNSYGYTEGYRYQTLSRLTGGVVGDVCASNYADQVRGIAEGVRKTLKTFTLACEPSITEARPLVIKKSGVTYSGKHILAGLNLIFEEALPEGDYEVEYSCLK